MDQKIYLGRHLGNLGGHVGWIWAFLGPSWKVFGRSGCPLSWFGLDLERQKRGQDGFKGRPGGARKGLREAQELPKSDFLGVFSGALFLDRYFINFRTILG